MKWFYDSYSKTHINTACMLVSIAFAVFAQFALAKPINPIEPPDPEEPTPVPQPTSIPQPTPYMQACADAGVPIPPDWAETGTPWVNQGELQTKLINSDKKAFVWTYSDPSIRGACIALPRGEGVPRDVAGIICQSATTGAACFWDNMPKNNQRPGILGWKNQTLRIADLADGSNLTGVTGVCTNCHRGNNVFLISPDDPTWAKVLTEVTNPGSTFTTRVEASSDNTHGYPRYVPIAKPSWINTFITPPADSKCVFCHELPSVSAPPMPPLCADGGVENCYKHNFGWLPSVLDLVLN